MNLLPGLLRFFISSIFLATTTQVVFAEPVSGNGYIVEQVISPADGSVSGNGYVISQTAQPVADKISGNNITIIGPFGTSTTTTTGGGGGGGGGGGSSSGGGGFYYFPPNATTSASSTPVVNLPVVLPGENKSTCDTRVTFSSPIDVGSPHNVKEDVKKLENFLNTYENEKLPVNGIYEPVDIVAVKRWQQKYQSYILAPMLLKKPTGTVYTLSQRQIERQTTKACGEAIKVTACPYFNTYAKYGDRNDAVKKIQQFLNIVRGEKLNVNGIYGPLTKEAVLRFQKEYRKDIFNFFKLSFLSGNWNVSTRAKANAIIGCPAGKLE